MRLTAAQTGAIMDNDFLLIRKMKNGSEQAMDLFVAQYYNKILRYCYFHCDDRAHAEDLTQETFARFFEALAKYQHMGKAINFLYVIARNLCTDFHNKKKEIITEYFPDPGENPTEAVEMRLDMKQALENLPEEIREVVILHYFQDYSLREVSSIMNIGLPLTKYRIKKAKAQLSVLLGKEDSN